MKAIIVSQYGGPEVMKFGDCPDPSPGPDEVLVRVAATSINPFDLKRRSGEAKAFAPISFPGTIGVDVAGTVIRCGADVKGFSAGDRVFGMADQTYAEQAEAAAGALREAGASTVLLAGKPGVAGETDNSTIDGYVYAGCDAIEVLTGALDQLGVQA